MAECDGLLSHCTDLSVPRVRIPLSPPLVLARYSGRMPVLHPHDLRGRSVLVLGLGSFGGGAGCARYLSKLGADVTVTDLRDADRLDEALAMLAGVRVKWALGGHSEALFEEADVVVVNPAVPPRAKWLAIAREHGCVLTTEVNLAIAQCSSTPAFAVTGTHGKSTCVALTAHLLSGHDGRVVLAGNLGGSMLESTAGLTKNDRLIVELSSFQLERLVAPDGWPHIASLTSLGADHLDWHESLESYHKAKQRITAHQHGGCTLLLPESAVGTSWQSLSNGGIAWLSEQLLQDIGATEDDLPFHEKYRMPSLLAAIVAARQLGANNQEVLHRLRDFPGLPHRMMALEAPAGMRVLDNAVATHPEPTAAALLALDGPVLLLAGGYDKGLPLNDLVAAMLGLRVAHLHGPGGKRLAVEASAAGCPVRFHADTATAMQGALEDLSTDETLLYSPTFSSFDEFRNFADRAKLFHKLYQNWLEVQ